jgi:hypothetical protein
VRQITLLGSRFEESARRAVNLDDQGAGTGVVEHQGRLLSYPISSWTTSDVWDFILFSQPFGKGGPFPSYADSLAMCWRYTTVQLYRRRQRQADAVWGAYRLLGLSVCRPLRREPE